MSRKKIPAVAYLRTSSLANASKKGLAGDKDSDKRQRAAIESYAKPAAAHVSELTIWEDRPLRTPTLSAPLTLLH